MQSVHTSSILNSIPEVRAWRAELKKRRYCVSMSQPRPSHKLPCALLWQSFKDGGIA